MKFSREIKIGVFFFATVALFVYGFNFLKGRDIFSSEKHYFAVYESVGGLVQSSPVYVNGLKVGLVKELRFLPDGSNRVLVDFALTEKFPVPLNSIARVYSADLMNTKAIDLKLGDSAVLAKPGDTLPTEMQASLQESVNRQVLPLKIKAEALMGSLDSAITIIRYVFNEQSRENLEKSFLSIKMTIQSLEHTSYNIDTLVSTQRGKMAAILTNIESITLNIKNNNQRITEILSNFNRISDTIARAKIGATLASLNETLEKTSSVMTKIDKGEGSLGLLINNQKLYQELEKSSRDLNLLLEDIRLNPERYLQISVFGRNPKKNTYTPPVR